MRSNVLRFSFGIVPLALAAGVGLAVGCASTSSFDAANNNGSGSPSNDSPTQGIAAPALSDAAAGTAFVHGNPLCHMSINSCLPDSESGCSPPSSSSSTDAGVPASSLDGSAPPPAKACRIELTATPDGGSDYAPKCLDKPSDITPRGVDGTTCASGSDCAPGYDCIVGPSSGICRHYCCSGSCDGDVSKSGGPTFCDIQQLFSLDRKRPLAPVCMPIKKCHLLMPGDCSERETCAVVTENGDTGCVAVGNAKVGDSCDTEHCIADATCLGTAGDRHCYQLCTTDGSQCLSGQTCTTGSLFQDTSYGVCRDSTK